MISDDYTSALIDFIRTEFLSGDERAALTATTPLVDSGVLDSLRVAVLLTYIRDGLGVQVPLAKMDSRNFADIRTIAAMLAEEQGVRA